MSSHGYLVYSVCFSEALPAKLQAARTPVLLVPANARSPEVIWSISANDRSLDGSKLAESVLPHDAEPLSIAGYGVDPGEVL